MENSTNLVMMKMIEPLLVNIVKKNNKYLDFHNLYQFTVM